MSKAPPIEPGVSTSWAQQSPIDLGKSYYTTELPKLTFDYTTPITGVFEDDHNFHVKSGSATITLHGPTPELYAPINLMF